MKTMSYTHELVHPQIKAMWQDIYQNQIKYFLQNNEANKTFVTPRMKFCLGITPLSIKEKRSHDLYRASIFSTCHNCKK